MSESYSNENRGRDSDLVLGPNQMANVQDGTKGGVQVYVGPIKVSLSNTDISVVWSPKHDHFVPCTLQESISSFSSADEGSYVILEHPPEKIREGREMFPDAGKANSSIELERGRKINIPGPATFALWPGQTAKVIPGHTLRSNQYLIARVINEEAAQENWTQGVMRPQSTESGSALTDPGKNPGGEGGEGGPGGEGGEGSSGSSGTDDGAAKKLDDSVTDVMPGPAVVMGQLIVIKGNDVSFYIPPTGLVVVPDSRGEYVREAVTLERLEYCILLDESGEKRYVKGPAVVFPSPTETFVHENGKVKQHAIELTPIQGLNIKVIADYKEGKEEHKAGSELFVTGKEMAIYYPRPEHSIISYGDEDVHYAVAIPPGEARYVLNRTSGEIRMAKGPVMLLPDPREEVIVRRVLNDDQVSLWFPGNEQALLVNQEFKKLRLNSSVDFVTERHLARRDADDRDSERHSESESIRGQQVTRRSTFTPPESVSVDGKYDGAVRIDLWPGYVVMVVDKTNKRRVEIGPQSILLDFGETLMPMTLSMGRPKNDSALLRTPFLKASNNTVSDVVELETSDLFKVTVELSYRVNFEGENPEKWFDQDNYVKFLTDHQRSRLRAKVKEIDIRTFHAMATSIIRDTVLGEVGKDGEARTGCHFEENDMRIYDTEVLKVTMDSEIHQLLADDSRKTVIEELRVSRAEAGLEFTTREEEATRAMLAERAETDEVKHGLTMQAAEQNLQQVLARVSSTIQVSLEEVKGKSEEQKLRDGIAKAKVSRIKLSDDQTIARAKGLSDIDSSAYASVLKAVSPELTAAMQAFGDKQLAAEALQKMGPMVGAGDQVIDLLTKMFAGISDNTLPGSAIGKKSRSTK